MLPKLQCVLFDDDAAAVPRYRRWIGQAWDDARVGVTLDVAWHGDVEQAIAACVSDQNTRLLIADVYVGEQRLGLEVIRDVRRARGDSIGIMAFSKGDVVAEREARRLGADEFMPKALLLEPTADGIPQMAERFRRLAAKRNLAPPIAILEFNDADLKLSLALAIIKEATVARLVETLIGTAPSRATVAYVRPGLSGAAVFRVIADVDRADYRRRMLLKVSRERETLEQEVRNRATATEFPTNIFLATNSDQVAEVGGWFAITTPFVEDARTLGAYLADGALPMSEAIRTLERLWTKVALGQLIDTAEPDKAARPNEAVFMALTSSRKLRIQLALEELKPLAAACNLPVDAALIESCLRALRFGSVDMSRVRRGTKLCLCHGDLHMGNVLVDVHGSPLLIDAANVGKQHWSCDLARLTADMVLQSLAKPPASYMWNSVDQWRAAVDQLFGRGQAEEESIWCSGASHAAVNWMFEYVRGSARYSEEPWAWPLALAVEFMRGAYRISELPAPIRVLSLYAASVGLTTAAAVYDRPV